MHQFYYQIALLGVVNRYAWTLDFNHFDNVTMLDRSQHLDVLGHFKRGSLERLEQKKVLVSKKENSQLFH